VVAALDGDRAFRCRFSSKRFICTLSYTEVEKPPPMPYTLQKSLRHLTTAMKANSRSHSHWKCSNIVNTSRQARFDTCTTCMLSRRILDARLGFDGCHGSVEFTIASEYQAISLHRGYTSERWLFHILPIENDGGNMSPPLRK